VKTKRIDGLDIFRGFAILAMILYHFTYDLNYFRIISLDMNHTLATLVIRYTIISIFLLSMGMSLALVHNRAIKWSSIRKRILQLGLASLLVTVATYIVFPTSWIYFGILHFILVASLITVMLLKFPKVILLLTLVILIGSVMHVLNMNWLYALLKEPLFLPNYTEDLVPLFPWLAVVFIGTLLVHHNLHEKIFKFPLFNTKFRINRLLKKMGQHSLLIYLIHQAIIFGAFELYFRFFSK